ncbi:MAG: calcium-binding protein [Hyphomicrobiales bacterium]|nr:calcium-binding protein [Hyphomicrobiales bacterium]
MTGSNFDDRLIGDANDNVLTGGDGNDLLKGKGGTDTFYGNDGDDKIIGDAGNDTMYGGKGNDILSALAGLDTLNGGAGNDVLTGGIGSGVLDGSMDTFVYENTANGGGGFDRIKDFEDGIDIIDLQSFSFASFADVTAISSDTATGLRIDAGGGDVLLIENFYLASFDAGDMVI